MLISSENKAFLNSFALLGLYPQELWKIHNDFGNDFKRAWEEGSSYLSYITKPERLSIVINKKQSISPEREFQRLSENSIHLFCPGDQEYPSLLRQIDDPPFAIYVRGNLDALRGLFALAVVGSRKISSYGQQIVNALIPKLSALPLSIISGLAYGVDALAHQCALEAGLHTVAVLGSGIDNASVYPRMHRELAQKIIASDGALISEFAPGIPANDFHFPMRNRIIAGMSRAVIIVEAAKKSGALITAQCALDYNRDVYAVPGSIFAEQCEGTNALIYSGAKLLANAEELVKDYPELAAPRQRTDQDELTHKNLSAAEQKIIKAIAAEGSTINQICTESGLDISTVNATVIVLKIKGYLNEIGNNRFAPKHHLT